MEEIRRHAIEAGSRRARACYDLRVTSGDIRGFLDRDWARLADAKARAWTAGKQTPAHDLRTADQLRRYVLSIRADWPSADDRDADRQTHIRVSEALGAAVVRSR